MSETAVPVMHQVSLDMAGSSPIIYHFFHTVTPWTLCTTLSLERTVFLSEGLQSGTHLRA